MLCTQTPGGVHEDDYVQMLLRARGLGDHLHLGLARGHHGRPHALPPARDRQLPIVLVNGYTDGVDAPFISTDDAAAASSRCSTCARSGHRRIGLAVGPERFVPAQRKIAGFRRGMADVASPDELEAWIEQTIFTVEGGQAAALRLIERGCTAIVCGSDLMALGAMRGVRSLRAEVPDDSRSSATTTRRSSPSPTRR